MSSLADCMSLALLSASACALAASTHDSCSAPSSAVVPLCMHVDGTLACMNSWSDTVRSQGPTGRRCTKGGVSGPAEDLLPVSEVEAGVICRPGGGCTGAGCRFTSQGGNQAQVPGVTGVGAVTPSLHPEIPDTRFGSPGRGLDIRQSMGWTKVCVEPHSRGFGCSRVTPELVCFPMILTTFGWDGILGDHTRPPGLGQGTTVCVHTSMDVEQQSDHKLITPSGMGLLFCGAGSQTSYHLGCGKKDVPTGANLNQYAGSGSCIPGHSDNESLFGPPNQPELIVSMSLGHSVVFQVRRAR